MANIQRTPQSKAVCDDSTAKIWGDAVCFLSERLEQNLKQSVPEVDLIVKYLEGINSGIQAINGTWNPYGYWK